MKRMNVIAANRVFLLSIILSQGLIVLVAGFGVQDEMLLQFLIEVFMAFPGVACLLMRKQSLKDGLGIRPIGWRECLLLLPLAFCISKIGEFINALSQLFTPNLTGDHMAALVLKYPFPVAFFVIAVTPAICEELIYRGVLYQGYRNRSVRLSIVLTAFLFGMMHMNLNQFSYAFVLGLFFVMLNEITGSILPSVLLHLFINGRSVVILYAATNYLAGLREQYTVAEKAGDTGLMEQLLQSAQGVPIDRESWLQEYMNAGSGSLAELLLSLLPAFLLAVVGAVVLIAFLMRCSGQAGKLRELLRGTEHAEGKKERSEERILSPSLVIGILICLAFLLLSCISVMIQEVSKEALNEALKEATLP